jgi:hypothetical protein
MFPTRQNQEQFPKGFPAKKIPMGQVIYRYTYVLEEGGGHCNNKHIRNGVGSSGAYFTLARWPNV